MNIEPTPPRWADGLLRLLLRPADRDPISGDFLEEYRDRRRSARGRSRANAWYVKHVISVLWFVIWPGVLAVAGLGAVAMTWQVDGRPLSFGGMSQLPGLSPLHALVYCWVGFAASRRTRLVRTGVLTAAVTALLGVTAYFATGAIRAPGLLVAPFFKPFIFVIISVALFVPMAYGAALGGLAGVVGRWSAPTPETRAVGS